MNVQSEKLGSLPLCLHLKKNKHFLPIQSVSLVVLFLNGSLGGDACVQS